jgi:L-asparaginase
MKNVNIFGSFMRKHHLTPAMTASFTYKPRVLVLFCGGTLIMKENRSGALVVSKKDEAIQLLLDLEPRIQEIAILKVHYVDNIDSTNMSPKVWDKIAKVIHDSYEDYDGFVITHGTDTMAFTASALSFVLGDLGKPVCITGSQIPASRVASDARRNFVNSIRLATLEKAGVMLVFDEDIILGARSSKVSESKLDAFRPINCGLHGEIRIDIRFSDDAKDRHDRPLQYQPGFESHIAVFNLFPGFSADQVMKHAIEAREVKAIILRGYGSGNISYEYLPALKLAQEKKIPVVVGTQCWEGATMMHLYDVGQQALDHGVIQAYDMSVECMTTKLMWVLKHAESYEKVREMMHTNYTGEINKEGKLY